MDKKITKGKRSTVTLEVTLTPQEFGEYTKAALGDAVAKVELKGFRRGTAPRELAERAVDRSAVFDTAVNEAVRVTLHEISDDESWTIIDKPQVEVLEAAPEGAEEKVGLRYRAKLVLFPEVKLPDYRKLAEKTFGERKPVAVSGAEIEKTIEWLRSSRAATARVTRSAMKGDVVEVDIESEAGGAPIPGGKISGDSFVLGESRFIPGFDEHIVGHQEGEVLRFSVAAPGDYWESSLRGKKVDFTVTVRAVFERKLPELTDDFAKSLGSAFVSLEALRKNVESGLSLEKAERERERLRAKVLEAMVVGTKVEVPDIMIERTLDGLVHEAKARGGAVAGDDAKLRESLRDRARERVLANLVLHRLVEAEGLEPTREEIEAEAERLKLDPEKHYDYSYGAVRHRKVFEFLESQAKQA